MTVWPTVTVRVWPWLVSMEMIVCVVMDVFSFGGLGLFDSLPGGFRQSSLCKRQRVSDGAKAVPSGPTEAGSGVVAGASGGA